MHLNGSGNWLVLPMGPNWTKWLPPYVRTNSLPVFMTTNSSTFAQFLYIQAFYIQLGSYLSWFDRYIMKTCIYNRFIHSKQHIHNIDGLFVTPHFRWKLVTAVNGGTTSGSPPTCMYGPSSSMFGNKMVCVTYMQQMHWNVMTIIYYHSYTEEQWTQ
jgi:hypothetical protein